MPRSAPLRSVSHASFTITRHCKAAPARVFAAFADEQQKAKWFAGPPGWEEHEKAFDFRESGKEKLVGRHPSGMVSSFDGTYHDIVDNERILYSYVMHLDGRKISVSQACIQITPDGEGSKLVVTEHGDFLDGYDDAGSREHGTGWLMDKLVQSLEG
jgi:uncharacterized protein YndB with AHSA1/START domain